ncbi:MAG: KpsF/GutQ family sugar-phosphate isomerase [Alphaproteobacteria bacterium]|nr:KpsF/GutQ family sugar-phosphate isomerase [Alphaproteobacteria bacterium]
MPKNGHISEDIAAAREALGLEADGLNALAAALDESFASTIDILVAVTGRVIVSGMGKSGLVARKIAATLASVGTPAAFVHPGEASHGDLGMVTANDALIALSNSGETEELSDLLDYAKRFAIPVIAISGDADSTLAKAADVALILPPAEEACPMGLAPTTSTTMMLALGDAIAVTLIKRRGFTESDFQIFHPGGRLSRRLMQVADLMHAGDELPLTADDTVMAEALIQMTQKRFGCVGVLDPSGELVGIITDGDLRRHMSGNLLAMNAADIMTRSPLTIRSSALASEALGLMNARRITSLFVVDGQRPVGILHIHDCLRAGVA